MNTGHLLGIKEVEKELLKRVSESNEWELIPGFDNYAISRSGEVIRVRHNAGTSIARKLKPALVNGKFPVVQLYKDGKGTQKTIKSLMRLTFGQ
mgnify:CR=1 FL=1